MWPIYTVDDFPIKSSIYGGFSMAMLNNQRVYKMALPEHLAKKTPPLPEQYHTNINTEKKT